MLKLTRNDRNRRSAESVDFFRRFNQHQGFADFHLSAWHGRV